jgi:hypothetical protein
MRWCIAATVICMSTATVAAADDVHAWIKKPTNIPAQGLAPALQILAKDRNFQIIYVSEEISGRRTQGAVGELTPEEAIKQLLEGTGLTFKYLDDKTITIVPASPAASRSPPEVSEASQAARASSSTAQGARPEAAIEPSKLPQVTIDAQREALEHRVSHFVTTLTEQAGSYESLARWHNKVCPLVAGLPRDRGDFVLERISTIAQSAGVPVGPRDCAPNFFVLFTSDPTKLLKNMVSHNASRFTALAGQRADSAALKEFIEYARPIRVWYNADLKGALGNQLRPFDEAGTRGNTPLQNDHPVMSRIQLDDVQEIASVLIVVDVRRIDGLKIGAVADYVAMVGLAKINPNADVTGDDSVLSLFMEPTEAQTLSQLSSWDAAFLKALYGTEQANKMQRHAIVGAMMHDASALGPQ